MFDNTRLHVLFLSLQEDRTGIGSKFQQKCKQDIKMQIADTTIDNFHNISSESVSVLFVKEMRQRHRPDRAERKQARGVDDRFLEGGERSRTG